MIAAIYALLVTWASWLQLVGAIAGFAAGIALSISPQSISTTSGIAITDRSGRQQTLPFVVLRYPRSWRAGLGALVVGFALQLPAYIIVVWKGPPHDRRHLRP